MVLTQKVNLIMFKIDITKYVFLNMERFWVMKHFTAT